MADMVHRHAELEPKYALDYAKALELWCAHFGERLPNARTYPCPMSVLEQLDTLKARHESRRFFFSRFLRGRRLSVVAALHRGPPIAIPRPDDFPSIGHFDVGQAMELTLDLDELELDARLRPIADELAGWCRSAMRARSDVVTFYG